jgi:hypothetical protein
LILIQGFFNKRARILAPPACSSAHFAVGIAAVLEAVSLNNAKLVAYALYFARLWSETNGNVDAAGYSVAAA